MYQGGFCLRIYDRTRTGVNCFCSVSICFSSVSICSQSLVFASTIMSIRDLICFFMAVRFSGYQMKS
jgi:hypothetical protein